MKKPPPRDKKKKKNLVHSDDDDEEEEDEKEEQSDQDFNEEEDDDAAVGSKRKQTRKRTPLAASSSRDNRVISIDVLNDRDDEDDDSDDVEPSQLDAEDEIDRTHIEKIEIQSVDKLKPQTGGVYYAKTPSFFRVESEPFKVSTFKGDDDVHHETIRWRLKRNEQGHVFKDAKGNLEIESNAKIVEFEDGSMQLLIGDEVINLRTMLANNEFVYARGSTTTKDGEDDLNESDGQKDEEDDKTIVDLSLQAWSTIKGHLQFLPSSSSSRIHRNFEARVKKEQQKGMKMRKTVAELDPEKEQDERIKKAEAFARKNLRMSNRPKANEGGEWDADFLNGGSGSRKKTRNGAGKSAKATTKSKKTAGKKAKGKSKNDDSEEELSDDRDSGDEYSENDFE